MNANLPMLLKRLAGIVLAAILFAIAGSGCRTAHGFGEDMEKAGEKIQDGTK